MRARVIVVAKRRALKARLLDSLRGLGCLADGVADAGAARTALRSGEPPHMLVLAAGSLSKPEFSLLDAVRKDPRLSNVFALCLTASDGEAATLDAFAHGADELLSVSIASAELSARLRAMLRRIVPDEGGDKFSYQDLTLNSDAQRLWIGGRETPLTRTEFQLLHLFVQKAGRTLSRAYLVHYLWNTSEGVRTRSIDMHISHLRRKLKPSACRIETVRPQGYRLTDE